MKITFQERLILKQILRGYHSDTNEMQTVKIIYDKIEINPSERKIFEISERPDGFSIGLDQENEIAFITPELDLLKKLYGLIEANGRVNLDNLSLCVKIRDAELS